MGSTKEKILSAALKLFNKEGVNKVTLRDIAKEISISTGNLAYHYRNKDHIIEAIFRQMKAERDEILGGVQQIPSLDKIYNQNKYLIALGKKYLFFFVDIVQILRTYPAIGKLHQAYLEQSKLYVKGVLDYSVGSGNMRPEKIEGEYGRLAHTIWMLTTFWLNQLVIRDKKCTLEEEKMLLATIWDLMYPKMTQKGLDNYKKLFEEDKTNRSKTVKTGIDY